MEDAFELKTAALGDCSGTHIVLICDQLNTLCAKFVERPGG